MHIRTRGCSIHVCRAFLYSGMDFVCFCQMSVVLKHCFLFDISAREKEIQRETNKIKWRQSKTVFLFSGKSSSNCLEMEMLNRYLQTISTRQKLNQGLVTSLERKKKGTNTITTGGGSEGNVHIIRPYLHEVGAAEC